MGLNKNIFSIVIVHEPTYDKQYCGVENLIED